MVVICDRISFISEIWLFCSQNVILGICKSCLDCVTRRAWRRAEQVYWFPKLDIEKSSWQQNNVKHTIAPSLTPPITNSPQHQLIITTTTNIDGCLLQSITSRTSKLTSVNRDEMWPVWHRFTNLSASYWYSNNLTFLVILSHIHSSASFFVSNSNVFKDIMLLST